MCKALFTVSNLLSTSLDTLTFVREFRICLNWAAVRRVVVAELLRPSGRGVEAMHSFQASRAALVHRVGDLGAVKCVAGSGKSYFGATRFRILGPDGRAPDGIGVAM